MGKVTLGNNKSSKVVQTAVSPKIITNIVEKIVEVPVEKIVIKEIEKIVNVPVEKIIEVEKIVEVKVPYEVIKEVIVEKLVLNSELLNIEVDRIDKLIEQSDSELKAAKQKLEIDLELAQKEIKKLQLEIVKEHKNLNIKLIALLLLSVVVAVVL